MDRENKTQDSREEMHAKKEELIQIFETLPSTAQDILLIAARMASIQNSAA